MVLKVEFDEEFENKFRELAMRKYGFYKGSLKKASEEALSSWMKSEENNLPSIKDPIDSIRGIMKHLKGKVSSIELQHDKSVWLK